MVTLLCLSPWWHNEKIETINQRRNLHVHNLGRKTWFNGIVTHVFATQEVFFLFFVFKLQRSYWVHLKYASTCEVLMQNTHENSVNSCAAPEKYF